MEGEYQGKLVAVKMTKNTTDVAAFKDFLREVKIMAYIGSHENIVEFLGAPVTTIRVGMEMEYNLVQNTEKIRPAPIWCV